MHWAIPLLRRGFQGLAPRFRLCAASRLRPRQASARVTWQAAAGPWPRVPAPPVSPPRRVPGLTGKSRAPGKQGALLVRGIYPVRKAYPLTGAARASGRPPVTAAPAEAEGTADRGGRADRNGMRGAAARRGDSIFASWFFRRAGVRGLAAVRGELAPRHAPRRCWRSARRRLRRVPALNRELPRYAEVPRWPAPGRPRAVPAVTAAPAGAEATEGARPEDRLLTTGAGQACHSRPDGRGPPSQPGMPRGKPDRGGGGGRLVPARGRGRRPGTGSRRPAGGGAGRNRGPGGAAAARVAAGAGCGGRMRGSEECQRRPGPRRAAAAARSGRLAGRLRPPSASGTVLLGFSLGHAGCDGGPRPSGRD